MVVVNRIEPSSVVRPLLEAYLIAHLADLNAALGLALSASDALRTDLEHLEQFASPSGAMFVASLSEQLAGCVGLRAVAAERGHIAELKRLFVRQELRGYAIGRQLVLAALDYARDAGFKTVRLDTFEGMTVARHLYETLGFRITSPFVDTAIPEQYRQHWIYMELDL